MITVNWAGLILFDNRNIIRISMRSQYGVNGGDIPARVSYVNQLPTEQPATITIEVRDLSFSQISNLKGLFYNSANYSTPAPVRSGTLKIGQSSFDNCNLERLSFNYTKVFSTNLFATPGSPTNIGIWGEATIRFNRWLTY